MKCESVDLPGGGKAILCYGRGRRRRCTYPGCATDGSVLCDHDTEGKTCDRLTCRAHAKPIGKNVDWCWQCAREEAKRGNSPRLAL